MSLFSRASGRPPRLCPSCGERTDRLACPNDQLTTVDMESLAHHAHGVQPGMDIAGRYTITGRLGEGAYGTLYTATHLSTRQPLAVKMLSIDGGSEQADRLVRRFYREAHTTSGLAHPNTVRVFDFGQTERGPLYIAMELLRGVSLGAAMEGLIQRGRGASEQQAIAIAVPILRSLAEAHEAGLVHRDLKPDNIMLCPVRGGDIIVKVLDFGIARAAGSQLTAQGKTLGTPGFMSPEQIGGGQLDARSDLYALAVMLFGMLCCRLPFQHSDPFRLMFMVRTETAPDIREHTTVPVSDAFAQLVATGLSVPPNSRHADANAMRQALMDLSGGTWANVDLSELVDLGIAVDGPISDPQPMARNSRKTEMFSTGDHK